MTLPRQTAISLYRSMQRIRKVELAIEERYGADQMKTPVHLCIGQEAVATGVCAALRTDDYISSNHRGHGHYLAKGGNLSAMIAELHCRTTGCSGGYGGSMHLVDTSVGHMGSSSIVGGGIPIATGLALSIQMKQESKVSVAFLGDGAADEGVLYESLNFAMLKKLPVVYVLENNRWAVCSSVASRWPGEALFHHLPQTMLLTRRVDGNDVAAVLEAAQQCVAHARSGQGPAFVECQTYRLRGHAGAGSDARLGYRPSTETTEWEQRCPVASLRRRVLDEATVSAEELSAIDRQIDEEVSAAFEAAMGGSLAAPTDVTRNVFRE
jgi:pyruvate dehydrogenase E1 component alpha subunit